MAREVTGLKKTRDWALRGPSTDASAGACGCAHESPWNAGEDSSSKPRAPKRCPLMDGRSMMTAIYAGLILMFLASRACG